MRSDAGRFRNRLRGLRDHARSEGSEGAARCARLKVIWEPRHLPDCEGVVLCPARPSFGPGAFAILSRMILSESREDTMRWLRLVLPATIALSFGLASQAAEEENAEDFMGIHKIEIIFHEAGTTKNLDLMLSLFADDATLQH